ncbi:Fe-S protein assembly co-chaperone HscB [Chromatiales bacterium (ex Bugula neritina AB1)]|nr:Fe-S protein assembly co-chaperone HscB [Chromatiales bacterium (ex Bugula neritina AB1)]
MTTDPFNLQQNYFELFGLSVASEVDEAGLRSVYTTMQRQFHPDKFAAASDRERRYAVQIAAFVNEAYMTLSDPLKRAEYQLQLQGGDTRSEADAKMDAMFLMEQMEWRENLDDITAGVSDPFAALDSLRAEINNRIGEIAAEVKSHLQVESTDDAAEGLRKWQFLAKLIIEAERVEARIDDELA